MSSVKALFILESSSIISIDIIIVNNNVNCPKIDPWWTPVFIGKVSHCTSSSLTDYLWLVEYYCCELHSNGSWLSH